MAMHDTLVITVPAHQHLNNDEEDEAGFNVHNVR